MVTQISVNFAQKLTQWHTHIHCNMTIGKIEFYTWILKMIT